MASFNCKCGYNVKVLDKHIGKTVKCPKCQNYVKITNDNMTTNAINNNVDNDNDKTNSRKNKCTNQDLQKQSSNNRNFYDKVNIPLRIKELIKDDEQILYASNPSRNALTISMIINGIFYGIVGLSFYLIGIIFIIPIALLLTYYSWKNKYYVITDSRTIVAQGIFNVAIKIINNKDIQVISINTGIIDRWLKLNSIELSTSGQGGSSFGILSFFPGMSKGAVTLKQIVVKDVMNSYYK